MLHFHQFTCLLFAGIFSTALCCQIPQWERISQHAVPPQPALSAAAIAGQTATAAVTAQSQSVTSAVSATAAPAVETTAPAQTTALTTTAPIPHTELVCTAEMVQAAACESSAEIPSEPTVTETVPAATEPAAAALELQPIEAQTLLGAQETWFKAYMDYRTITDTASRQYQLQQSAWTDDQGLRRLGEDYLVAMGTGWLNEGCGERFQVTLDSGAQFTTLTAHAGTVPAEAVPMCWNLLWTRPCCLRRHSRRERFPSTPNWRETSPKLPAFRKATDCILSDSAGRAIIGAERKCESYEKAPENPAVSTGSALPQPVSLLPSENSVEPLSV